MSKKNKTATQPDHIQACQDEIQKACKDMEIESKVAQSLDARTATFLSGAWYGLRVANRILYDKMCDLENKDTP